ncbi:MAG: EVE domain-containing protein [Chlamydiae bacterium]|nr:EVE domain-containing protein [Chlamydiota bacterium]
MSVVASAKYWISTVSREHVLIGKNEGFCQVCHGKKGPLSRMKKEDWIVYYSPKMSMEGKELCQKFTAIGKMVDDKIYQFAMNQDFVPFRRNVTYLKDAEEKSIHSLLDKLSFTKDKKNWGAKFRFGIFEISKEDFDIIYREMAGEPKSKRKQEEDLITTSTKEGQKRKKNLPLESILKQD